MPTEQSIGHPEDGGPKLLEKHDLTYNSYLQVPELLRLQKPLSEPPAHDELLFIVIHQTYELWFRQIIFELEATLAALQRKEVLEAHLYIKRVDQIMRVLVQQIHLLETMATVDFLAFRDRINPASGDVVAEKLVSSLSENDVKAKLAAAGYSKIHDVDFDDGVWKAEAERADGNDVEIHLAANTGEIIHVEND